MSNLSSIADKPIPLDRQLEEAATLVAAGLKAGRVKIHPDFSFTLDGNLSSGLALPFRRQETPAVNILPNKLQFDGKIWTLQYDGKVVIDSDRVGWHYGKQLVYRMRKAIHCTDLVTGAYGEPEEIMDKKDLLESGVAVSEDDMEEISGRVNLQVVTAEFSDEILPDENRAFVFGLLEKEYKRLAMLEKKGQPAKILIQKEKIKADIKIVEKYLNEHRYKGRNVCFENRSSRDRTSVTNAITRAIEKIEDVHPSLAKHLRDSIETGIYCIYAPNTDVVWTV